MESHRVNSIISGRSPRHANLCLRFVYFVFCFMFFGASTWHRKPPQVCSSVVYTPRHAKTSSHSHPQKQSLGLRHSKALACIPPARSWLLLRVMASRARQGSLPDPPTEDGHVSRGEQKAQTASQYSSVYS